VNKGQKIAKIVNIADIGLIPVDIMQRARRSGTTIHDGKKIKALLPYLHLLPSDATDQWLRCQRIKTHDDVCQSASVAVFRPKVNR
jgi:hypothetical protein